MVEFLFNSPWWMYATVAAAGAILFWQGNRVQNAPQRNTGTGVIIFALIMLLLGWIIETPIEKVTRQTRELAAAVEKKDWAAFKSLLDPKVNFWRYPNRDSLAKGAEATADSIGLKSVTITSLQAKSTATTITVDIDCLSIQDLYPYPARTSWRFEWHENADGWKLYRIEATQNQQIGPGEIEKHLK